MCCFCVQWTTFYFIVACIFNYVIYIIINFMKTLAYVNAKLRQNFKAIGTYSSSSYIWQGRSYFAPHYASWLKLKAGIYLCLIVLQSFFFLFSKHIFYMLWLWSKGIISNKQLFNTKSYKKRTQNTPRYETTTCVSLK